MSRSDDPPPRSPTSCSSSSATSASTTARFASGEELRSVDLLAGYLAGAGDHETYEPQPGRTSLVARIEGTGPRRAVAAPDGAHRRRARQRRTAWSRDPFAGEVVDGFVWGRGAVDNAQSHPLAGGCVPSPRRQATSSRAAPSSTSRSPTRRRWAPGARTGCSTTSATPCTPTTCSPNRRHQIPTPNGPRLPVLVAEKGQPLDEDPRARPRRVTGRSRTFTTTRSSRGEVVRRISE